MPKHEWQLCCHISVALERVHQASGSYAVISVLLLRVFMTIPTA